MFHPFMDLNLYDPSYRPVVIQPNVKRQSLYFFYCLTLLFEFGLDIKIVNSTLQKFDFFGIKFDLIFFEIGLTKLP